MAPIIAAALYGSVLWQRPPGPASELLVFLNVGDGSFVESAQYAMGSESIDLGDVDGDGHLDIAVANENGVAVLRNAGGGSFEEEVGFTAGSDPRSVVLGDVNDDGAPDLAVANHGSGDVSVLLNTCVVYCPADLDDAGDVGFPDLTQLLSAWGTCAPCPEDLDGDGEVGFADLTTLLSAWGPC